MEQMKKIIEGHSTKVVQIVFIEFQLVQFGLFIMQAKLMIRERLYDQIAGQIESRIVQGIYLAGERLPGVRRLSQEFGVSIGTVLEAQYRLQSAGRLEARARSGYFVRAVPEAMPQLLKAKTKHLAPRLVTGQELVLQLVTATTAPRVLQLGATVPHPDYQPTHALARHLRAALRDHPQAIARYEFPPGHEPLRRIIAARMALAGCEVNPEQITITNGCQEAVTTCLSLVAKRGDVIAVESPAYFGMLQAIQLAGMKALEINTDPEQGIDLDALQNALDKWPVKACVLSANASNPLGCTMSDDAKHALVKMLARHRVALIEDDAYGDLSFSQQRPKACFSYQQKHPVYYCSSFSKTICPGLRVGWIVSPQGDQQARLSKFLSNIATATVEQVALASYLRSGAYDRHLRDRRTQYAGNAAELLRDILEHFPLGTRASRPQGGITIWVELPDAANTLELAEVCLQHDIGIFPGQVFSASGRYGNCLRLSYALPYDQRVRQAVRKLATLTKQQLAAKADRTHRQPQG
ncbi:MAG: DNA-binding transcriptional MocR family regulator [Gammaproteobacteria bacterium]|jgi:DNA-binding transcriptional MocR family regulator